MIHVFCTQITSNVTERSLGVVALKLATAEMAEARLRKRHRSIPGPEEEEPSVRNPGSLLNLERKVRVCPKDEEGKEAPQETSVTFKKALDLRIHTKQINGVYKCETCHKRWSRDVNAAANMLRCYYSLAKHGVRPSYLARKKQRKPQAV
jgi:hypothetical protein